MWQFTFCEDIWVLVERRIQDMQSYVSRQWTAYHNTSKQWTDHNVVTTRTDSKMTSENRQIENLAYFVSKSLRNFVRKFCKNSKNSIFTKIRSGSYYHFWIVTIFRYIIWEQFLSIGTPNKHISWIALNFEVTSWKYVILVRNPLRKI